MTYQPKPGDFGVVTTYGTVSKLIRIGQWLLGGDYANYEHAFIFIGGTCNNLPKTNGIIEAEPGGARIAELSKYMSDDISWYRCPADKSYCLAIQATCLLGTPYSFLDYLAIVFQHSPWIVRKTLGKWTSGYVSSTKHMICSQLVDEVYASCDIQLFSDDRLPGNVMPDDLWELIEVQEKSNPYESI